MHCPQCGARVEPKDISYCTRCGQMLERIRAAMSEEAIVARGREVSRSGLNLGVVLMYAGLWPAMVGVLLTPSAIPLAFLWLTVALIGIIVGSGPLLRLFQTDEIHPEIERARRKEIAFGSALMFLGAIIATAFVALAVPDSWARVMIIGSITALFGALLGASKYLYSSYRELASNEAVLIAGAPENRGLKTTTLDPAGVDLQMPTGCESVTTKNLHPMSVTDETTRSLDERG